jgi:serine/threonine protein kinase
MVGREDEALVGQVIGERYRVLEVLGAGSTGTVFAVQHLLLTRPFAMKVFRPRHVTPDVFMRVFQTDVPPALRICHPSLCHVAEVGALRDGAPYLVTELLEGETLAARIARERLSEAAAVDLAIQLLSVMGRVHATGLLLRDPRPQNLFLVHRRGCRPLLEVTDFGLTRLLPHDRSESSWRAADLFAATHYFSPERTRGEDGVDVTSDLFIVASILYEALSGVRPFASMSFQARLDQIARAAHRPLKEVAREVSPDLAALVERGLAAHPGERFASADEMQDALRKVFEEPLYPSQEIDIEVTYSEDSVSPLDNAPSYLRRTHPLDLPSLNPIEGEDAVPTVTAAINTELLDEASAENTDRTNPPPPEAGDGDATMPTLIRPAIALDDETSKVKVPHSLRSRSNELIGKRPATPPAKK